MRPTLEDQITLSKMTDEECLEVLMPSKGWKRIDFWIFRHCNFFWRVIHWNWFEIY